MKLGISSEVLKALVEEEALCDFQRFWMLVRPRRSSVSEISREILRLENSVSSTILLWVLLACSLKSAGRKGGRQIKCAHAHIVCPPFELLYLIFFP
jgi:hypothetical protein